MKKNSARSFIEIRSLQVLLFIGLLMVVSFSPGPLFGETPGVSKTEILIGQSCALEGPTQALGKGMRDGALAYFNHVNAQGGIGGKKIRLISYNDGYETEACTANTNKLIDQDKVFLLFGYVGTPTATVAVPIAVKKEVPFFGPFTGAEFLRSPVERQVFNMRASYYQETEAMVEHLFKDKSIKRISVFYQDDTYGQAGLEGVRRALAKRDMQILNDAHYPRNTVDVEPAVKTLLSTNPGAVIMVGAYQPCAKFIQLMRQAGSEAIFLNVSFVGADALAIALANEGLGVVVTQVVPYPFDKRIPAVAEFHDLMEKYMPKAEPGFVSLEGFLCAKALCKILIETPDPMTRTGFIETAEKQSDVNLGGFPFSFSPSDHQGSDLVYFSQVGPGGFISPIKSLNDLYKYQK